MNDPDKTSTVTPPDTADLALLHRFIATGDREAIGELFEQHADSAYGVALRFLNNPSDAEDAVQDAFMNVLRCAGQYRQQCTVRGWLMSIVINSCRVRVRSAQRSKAREMRASTKGESIHVNEEPSEQLALARKAVRDLPDPYRVPLWMHFLEGHSYREIAFALNVPEPTIRSHISRGLDRIRKALALEGHTVGAVALGSLLAQSGRETASTALRTSLATLSQSAVPAPVAITKAATGVWVWAAGVCILVVASTAGYMALRSNSIEGNTVPKSQAQTVAAAPASPFKKSWRLIREGQTEGLRPTKGSWAFIPNGDVGYMQTADPLTVLQIELNELRLPFMLQVTLQPASNNSNQFYDLGAGSAFTGLTVDVEEPDRQRFIVRKPAPWMHGKIYFSKDGIDVWYEDRRVHATLGRLVPSDLQLLIQGMSNVSEISIQEIQEGDVPSLSALLASVERVPADKREGTMQAPGLPKHRLTFVPDTAAK